MLENSRVIVDIDSCTKCRACVNVCKRYYHLDSDVLHFDKAMDEFCIDCGKCVAVCPVGAIKLKVHLNEKLQDVPSKESLPSFDSLVNLFQTRRSRRQFKEDPVPKDLIERILNTAARYSPTGHNQENVYYTVIQDRDILKNLTNEITNQVKNLVEKFKDPEGKKSLASVLPAHVMIQLEEVIPAFKRNLIQIAKGQEVWTWNAELIIIHSPKDSMTLVENCSLAACHVMLAAETLGLGTCSLGYLTAFLNIFRSVAKIFKKPIKHSVGYSLAIGYPKAHYHRIPARKPLKAKWL